MRFLLTSILLFLLLTAPLFGQSKKTSVLFQREVNGKFEWFENSDDDKDRKYVGEIKNGNQMVEEPLLQLK